MSKVRIYLVGLCAIVALCSCDFSKHNSALVNGVGKALAEEVNRDETEAKGEKETSVSVDADDKLVMQTSPKGTPEQMLERTGYVASYNKTTRLPNWVAWHLTAELSLIHI